LASTSKTANAGEIFKKARDKLGYSQADLASRLKVAQATVSRLERGLNVTDKVFKAAFDVLSGGFSESDRQALLRVSYRPDMKVRAGTSRLINWSVSTAVQSERWSGDVIAVAELGNRTAFMIADAAGEGDAARDMAAALEFGFYSVVSALPGDLFHPGSARMLFERAYRSTVKRWAGPPSVTLGTIDDQSGIVGFINSGMPAPMLQRRGVRTAAPELISTGKTAALGSDSTPVHMLPSQIEAQAGDAFLFYSDGFIEAYESTTRTPLIRAFSEAAKLLVGDSSAILSNLVDTLSSRRNSSEIAIVSDDMSAMVIARNRSK